MSPSHELRLLALTRWASTALARSSRVVLGQAFEHSANLELLEGDGGRERVTVLNLAAELASPSQAVADPEGLAALRRHWIPGEEVLLLWEHGRVVGMDTPVLSRGSDIAGSLLDAAREAVTPWLARSWFASGQGQSFGLPALDAAIAGDPVRLLGMGSGLTPAGDDALVALIAWVRCTGGDLSVFQPLAALLDSSTTSTSATLLRSALDGQTSVVMNDLLGGLAGAAGATQLRGLVAGVAAIGHSSGADALFALHRLWTHPPALDTPAMRTPAMRTPETDRASDTAPSKTSTPLPQGDMS